MYKAFPDNNGGVEFSTLIPIVTSISVSPNAVRIYCNSELLII